MILDPLRADVKEAVAVATRAGVYVRMVTGTLHTLIHRKLRRWIYNISQNYCADQSKPSVYSTEPNVPLLHLDLLINRKRCHQILNCCVILQATISTLRVPSPVSAAFCPQGGSPLRDPSSAK